VTTTNHVWQLTGNWLIPTDCSWNQSPYKPSTHAMSVQPLLQLVCDSPDSLTEEMKYLDNILKKEVTAGTSLDTNTNLTLNQTLTWHLSLLQPYLTWKGLLKWSHGSCNPTTPAFLTNLYLYFTTAIDDIKDKDKLRDRQGAVYKIKWTVRPLILARLANERLEMVISTITFAEHQLQTNHGINWVSAKCITKSMDYF